jgi:hypothetical protein
MKSKIFIAFILQAIVLLPSKIECQCTIHCYNGGSCNPATNQCLCPCCFSGAYCQTCNFFKEMGEGGRRFRFIMRFFNFNKDLNPCSSNPCGTNLLCSANVTTCTYNCLQSKFLLIKIPLKLFK